MSAMGANILNMLDLTRSLVSFLAGKSTSSSSILKRLRSLSVVWKATNKSLFVKNKLMTTKEKYQQIQVEFMKKANQIILDYLNSNEKRFKDLDQKYQGEIDKYAINTDVDPNDPSYWNAVKKQEAFRKKLQDLKNIVESYVVGKENKGMGLAPLAAYLIIIGITALLAGGAGMYLGYKVWYNPMTDEKASLLLTKIEELEKENTELKQNIEEKKKPAKQKITKKDDKTPLKSISFEKDYR